ncbi:EAL domain-containing protein [Pleurocapsales cyanobacterium LEGE 06147]|nr:EAL domain-containing protein [Pleurocapsales cyanobacterium LEGE 06147]
MIFPSLDLHQTKRQRKLCRGKTLKNLIGYVKQKLNINKKKHSGLSQTSEGLFLKKTSKACTPSQPINLTNIRLKFSLAFIAFMGIMYAASSSILLSSLRQAEEYDCRQIAKRVLGVFRQTQEDFDARFSDYAAWDDTYQFIEDRNQHYLDSTLAPEILTLIRLNLILYIHSSGRIVFGTGFDYHNKKHKPIPEEIQKRLHLQDPLLQHDNPKSRVVGIIALPEGVMLIASRPILTSQGTGPIRGTQIVGRYLSADRVEKISEITRTSVSAYNINDHNLPEDVKAAYSSLLRNREIFVRVLNHQTIAGYALVDDIYGNPAMLLQVSLPRDIYKQGQSSFYHLTGVLVIVGLVSGVLILKLLNKLIFIWNERQEREERYRAVITQASEGIFLVDTTSNLIVETNPAFKNLFGYSHEEILGLKFENLVANKLFSSDRREIPTTKDHFAGEYQYRCRNGNLIDVEVSANLIPYNQGEAYCIVVRDISERKQAEVALKESEKRLSWQASHDSLTELANRREFERILEYTVKNVKELEQHALLYLDLDQFKIINDTCGHAAGDELLRQVSALFENEVRKTDLVARLGGDEFGILLHCCPMEQAIQIAKKLHEQVHKHRFSWQDRLFTVSVSIGLVGIYGNTRNYTEILSAADVACYVAKNNGRNRIHIYQLNDVELERQRSEMQWASQIPVALEENRFCLYCQKIVPIDSTAIRQEHYEVLLRLIDRSGNVLPPMAFIPAAERYNLMHLIDRWVISTLFAYLEKLHRKQSQAYNKEGVSHCVRDKIYTVNLSGASLNDDRFTSFVKKQFAKYQIEPSKICFEITETLAITNLAKASELIKDMKTLGCHFALDDFGSGMSSFAYLKNLSVNYLKIDGIFVKNILHDNIASEMVEAIARIASVMGIETIAEFVENDAVLKKLKTLGVQYAQGYSIGKPLPLEVI